jgi:hypothetical protein
MNRVKKQVSVVILMVVGCSAAARAQAPSTVVDLPRVETGAAASLREIEAGGARSWTRPSLALAVNGNVNAHVAVTTDFGPSSGAGLAVLAGVRLSTGFLYGSERDPVPGRFIARILVGRATVGTGDAQSALQATGGADLLLSRTHPIGLHWELGYRVALDRPGPRSGGIVQIGLVFGPHLRRGAPSPPST